MNSGQIKRRTFLEATTAGVAGILLQTPASPFVAAAPGLKIEKPFHGAVLNGRHGQSLNGGLRIRVEGEAAPGEPVIVNGVQAQRMGEHFLANVTLREEETEIVASVSGKYGLLEHRIRVVWDSNSEPRYRFSIDDNSFFLRDIAQKNYASLFDCFYLQLLRGLHRKYQTKFVLNIYYATEDGFELPQFPDRYKSEWQANTDWLRLAFHAYANKPDRPYQYAGPEELIADLDKVREQIERFAGEEVYSPPTVIHWGMVQPSALKRLFERGVRVLSGDFRLHNGIWDINYFLDEARSEYLSRHDALKDFASGIVFSSVDLVCNNAPIETIVPILESLAQDPNRAEIMDLFTHEQYFWPFYQRYIPDHGERLDRAIGWVTEQGYRPVFFHEGFLGV